MSGPRWRGWLVAGAIFLLGLAVGGAGVAWLGVRAFRQALQNPENTRGLAARAIGRIGADLEKTLELTPDEAASVRTILDDSTATLKTLRARAVAEASEEVRVAIRRIAAALPPEKRAEFRRLIVRRYERLGLPPPAGDAP